MITIVKATPDDYVLLADIGSQTFIESHGESAEKSDIDSYVSEKYSHDFLQTQLADPDNLYHILYYNDKPAGYTKIILNCPDINIPFQNVTKLEKIFILKEFYHLKLGADLLNFNIDISKQNDQSGIWLFVWIKNERAIRFYNKHGFKVIANYDFRISATHTNPNYQMLLTY